jgi:2,4-dichlorophenol 6-monooxygenase
MSNIIDVPVIIIGGGGCGLTLSSFLSDYGIDHFLFERHTSTSIMPKAHYLNQRTMEILRQHNIADEIIKQSAPLKNFSQVAWATSLGGSEPVDRQVIHKRACFGGDDGSPKSEMYKYVYKASIA